MHRTLVAYFSESGSTAKLTKTIAEVTGGENRNNHDIDLKTQKRTA